MTLGSRIYHDEFGTPYVRRAEFDWSDPDCIAGGCVAASGDPADGYVVFLPRWPGDPNYALWPEWLRAIVPYEWSGDFTRGGWASGFREDAGEIGASGKYLAPELYFPRDAGPGAVDAGENRARGLYANLRSCGWGAWTGQRSSNTGERPRCEGKTGLGFDTLWEDIADHFRMVGGKVGAVFKLIAKIVSFVPGLGTLAAAALAGIGSLAAGENIGAALIDAAANAVPGGGIAKDAVMTAAAAARELVEGGDFGDVVLAGLRKGLEQTGAPIEALAAFDIGVALGTGQGMQEAGFKALALFAKGNDALERGLSYAKEMTKAAQSNTPIEQVLTNALASEVQRVAGVSASAAIAPVVSKIAADKKLLLAGSEALAQAMGVAEPIARAAQAIMRTGARDFELERTLTMTATQKAFEKYGAQTVVSKDFAPSWSTTRANAYLQRQALEDDSLKYTAQKNAQDAAFVRNATIIPGTSYRALYEATYGPIAPAPSSTPATQETPAVVAAPAPPARTSIAGDLALGGLIAAAGVAVVLFMRNEA